MTAAFVLDCSVTMSWLFHDEVTPATGRLLDRLDAESVIVPTIWFLEVTNVLAIGERSDRIPRSRAEGFIEQLSELEIEVDVAPSERVFSLLLPICRKHRLTSYDAMYLELAQRRKLPLATLDEPLRKAAKKTGVKLLGK